jgi:hypothetical protein
MSALVDPDDLVGLQDASLRENRPRDYYRTRRARFEDHHLIPFPDPVAVIAAGPIYLHSELRAWNAERQRMYGRGSSRPEVRG